MELLRATLNPLTEKDVVLVRKNDSIFVEVWKREEKLCSFSQDDYVELFEYPAARQILLYGLKKFFEGEHFRRDKYSKLKNHRIHYLFRRDKPFILIERDDVFPEDENGVAHSEQFYLGRTAWKSLLSHGDEIFNTLQNKNP